MHRQLIPTYLKPAGLVGYRPSLGDDAAKVQRQIHAGHLGKPLPGTLKDSTYFQVYSRLESPCIILQYLSTGS